MLAVVTETRAIAALSPTPESWHFRQVLYFLPLAPGQHMFHLVRHCGDKMIDDVPYVGHLEVVWGDFYGTDPVPKAKWGAVLVRRTSHPASGAEGV